jgi:uncharacterized membrane protein
MGWDARDSSAFNERPPAGALGFQNFRAWRQTDLYMFLGLQLLTAVAAFIIAARDAKDQRSRKVAIEKVSMK